MSVICSSCEYAGSVMNHWCDYIWINPTASHPVVEEASAIWLWMVNGFEHHQVECEYYFPKQSTDVLLFQANPPFPLKTPTYTCLLSLNRLHNMRIIIVSMTTFLLTFPVISNGHSSVKHDRYNFIKLSLCVRFIVTKFLKNMDFLTQNLKITDRCSRAYGYFTENFNVRSCTASKLSSSWSLKSVAIRKEQRCSLACRKFILTISAIVIADFCKLSSTNQFVFDKKFSTSPFHN